MSSIDFSIGGSYTHPYSETTVQLPTQQPDGGPENNTAFPHTPGLNALASATKIGDLEESSPASVDALKLEALAFCKQACDLSGPSKLEKLNEAQAKLETAIAIEPKHASAWRFLGGLFLWQAEFLSGPARLTNLKKAQEKIEASLEIESIPPSSSLNSLATRLIPQAATFYLKSYLSGPIEPEELKETQARIKVSLAIDPSNASALFILGAVLHKQAEPLSGEARSTNLNEAQSKLEASLDKEPSNGLKSAFTLFSLGEVLILQSTLLSGPDRLTKLKEAQEKFEAGLVIWPKNARALKYLDEIAQCIESSD